MPSRSRSSSRTTGSSRLRTLRSSHPENHENILSLTSPGEKYEADEYTYHDAYDATLKFLYRPYSITVLIGMLAYFLYVALKQTSTSVDIAGNTISGFSAATIAFLFIGILNLRNGPFIRPHPAFWRAVLAFSIVYLLILIFLLFQDLGTARWLIGTIDPSLGKALVERSYAEDCTLSWSAVWNQMDEFVLAHTIGWIAKALILRDHWICWIQSVMFEVMEYSLQHQLPNFAECWWDHWILDVFTCNWLGIYVGIKICEYLSMKTYAWRGIKEIPDVRGKVNRTFAQFTPHSWTSFDWAATKTFKGYMISITIVVFFLACELNGFYLKYLLWIPPTHWLNTARLVLHAVIGSVAVRETYQYFTDLRCKRLGMQAWLSIACICTETLICIKFGRGQFEKPAPFAVKLFWTVFVSALTAFPLWQFYLRPKYLRK